MDLELGGGAEHDVVNLSAGLQRAGHTPVVITSGGRLCQDVEAEGIPVLRMPVDHRSPLQLRRNARAIAEAVEAHRIDVLNPQGIYPALSCHWACRSLESRGKWVPNVATIHMLGRLTWWYYRIGAMVLNRHVDHVIVESECERRRLLQHGLRRPHTVIPNCFPPSKFAAVAQSREEIRRELNWADGTTCFIMPARMTREKQHGLLFEALSQREVRHLPIHVFLAGDGPLLAANQDRVRELSLHTMVTFGGFRRDLPRLYKAADAFLLCSSAESLPLSIREAMGASLPVIATDVGGISEAVEPGRSGFLVPSGDAGQLAGAIRTLATDPMLRRTMGRRGLGIYRAKFDYDAWILRTLEVMSAVHAGLGCVRHSRWPKN
jgi:glycosyltransferase involved in cell wall biosynthesis